MKRCVTIKVCLLIALLLQATGSVFAGPKLERLFYSYNASNGLADNSAQTLKCTKTGRMVITTIGHINFYDGASFTHIDPTPEDVFPLPKYSGHYRTFFDRHHHLWVKDRQAVTCLNLTTERFVSNVDSVFKGMGMAHTVEDIFCDVDNHLWVLSQDKLYGIDAKKTFPVQQKAELHDVDVYKKKQLLAFFANGVVSVYDMTSGKHLYDAGALDAEEAEKYSRSSVVLAVDNDYYQIRNGDTESVLLHFSVTARQWEKLMEMPYHLNNMVLYKGSLFIASENGYWTYHLKTGQQRHYDEFVLTDGRKLTTDINDMCFDHQGGLWLGTEKRGLLYSRPFKMPFVAYDSDDAVAKVYAAMMDRQLKLPENLPRHVNCVYKDSRGWTWTGTYTGLQLQKSGRAAVQVITQRDGLRNDMVHSVIEDNLHNMWVATSFGISQLYIRDDSVRHIETYIQSDNIPIESFVRGRAMKLDDGTIVMQSLDHVVAFHPTNFYEKELREMTLFPKLVRLMVNGHFIQEGTKLDGQVILDRAVTRLKDLAVNYNHNTLSMTFSGLNYMRPVQTYYRVRVRGIDDKWHVYSYANSAGRVDSRGMFHLTLTALSPGYYTVELQASLTPDTWLERPLTWRIHVKQPWWRSTGIYLLLGALFVICVLFNIYYLVKNTRLRFMKNNIEENLVSHIKNFSERCMKMSEEESLPLTTVVDDVENRKSEVEIAFDELMLKIVPYAYAHRNERFTMRDLAALTVMKPEKLNEVVMANIYRSPRQLAQMLRKQRMEAND